MHISEYVKLKRTVALLTQVQLAGKAGVGLRFIRELEQGKETLRLDKVNQVLALFGGMVGVVPYVEVTSVKIEANDAQS